MKTSGDRMSWLNAVANQIMDGGANPPSMDYLYLVIPDGIVTGINDGHNTAAEAFGEARRDDYRAGQQVIIQEMVDALREQQFVNGDDQALRWLKPLDGEWKITMGDRQFTVRGQRERRLSADRNMLGESDEADGSLIGAPGILTSGKSRPFEVEVIGPRGGITTQAFQVHPLALAIPPMTAREREALRTSIDRNGVKVPLVVFQSKVLDGRNRLYFASVLKKPVRIEEFTGTEEEARRYVAVLNLHRRQLNPVQRAVAVTNLFGEQAREETAEAYQATVGRPQKNAEKLPSETAAIPKKDRGREWHEIVARKANKIGLNVTASAIRGVAEIIAAPQTLAAVERGDIRTVAEANRLARAEKGLSATTETFAVQVQSVSNRLGKCVEHLNSILTDGTMPIGKLPDLVSERLNKIERLIPQVRQALRARR